MAPACRQRIRTTTKWRIRLGHAGLGGMTGLRRSEQALECQVGWQHKDDEVAGKGAEEIPKTGIPAWSVVEAVDPVDVEIPVERSALDRRNDGIVGVVGGIERGEADGEENKRTKHNHEQGPAVVAEAPQQGQEERWGPDVEERKHPDVHGLGGVEQVTGRAGQVDPKNERANQIRRVEDLR